MKKIDLKRHFSHDRKLKRKLMYSDFVGIE